MWLILIVFVASAASLGIPSDTVVNIFSPVVVTVVEAIYDIGLDWSIMGGLIKLMVVAAILRYTLPVLALLFVTYQEWRGKK